VPDSAFTTARESTREGEPRPDSTGARCHPFAPVPAGKYLAHIVKSSRKDGDDYVELIIEIVAGEHRGRRLVDRLHIHHSNAQSKDRALRQLSAICHAVGIMKVGDSEVLHHRPMTVHVGVRPASLDKAAGDARDESNYVKGYSAHDGAVPRDAYQPPKIDGPGMTIARQTSGGHLRKAWLQKPHHAVPEQIKKPTGLLFDYWHRPVNRFDDMATVLGDVFEDPTLCVVRGTPKTGALAYAEFRRQGETLTDAPCPWLGIDFDDVEVPAHIEDPANEPDAVLEHVMGILPDEFMGASAVWNMTGGAGIWKAGKGGKRAPKIRVRLYFHLARPITSAEAHDWLYGCPGVDMSIYTPSAIHYTAAPLFHGMTDPVRRRWGIWRGNDDSVVPPVIDMSQRARRERKLTGNGSAPMGGAGLGYEGYKAQIGDHEGGRGLYPAIISAVGFYFWKHGSAADQEWLRADLEAAIRAAPSHRDADKAARIKALPGLIAGIAAKHAKQEQERAEAKARAEEQNTEAERILLMPAFNVSTHSGEKLRRWTASMVTSFLHRALNNHLSREWCVAEIAFRSEQAGIEHHGDRSPEVKAARMRIVRQVAREANKKFGRRRTLNWQLAAGAGSGKSTSVARAYRGDIKTCRLDGLAPPALASMSALPGNWCRAGRGEARPPKPQCRIPADAQGLGHRVHRRRHAGRQCDDRRRHGSGGSA
jgi:Protein of unknown function (DUF669)